MINTPAERTVYTVSQLTEKIKSVLEDNFPFIWISGEISNFKSPVSGHFYFTLKDDFAQISAVMFRGQNRNLKFLPDNGMRITGFGRIGLYQPRGSYQIILEYIEPAGTGALQAAFEQLKMKLSHEGLFDASHKKPLPFLPEKIHLITSATGSVVHDIIQVLDRRYPDMDVVILPVPVQGDAAVYEITEALSLLNTLPDAEVAIIARGGGSLEDLSAFNSEALARAIFASHVPIVSAVGHETDFTICDFAADLRAPTPSAAAELVVPVKKDLITRQKDILHQLESQFAKTLAHRSMIVSHLSRRLVHPKKQLEYLNIRVDEMVLKLNRTFFQSLDRKTQALAWLDNRLKKESPGQRISRSHETVSRHHESLLYLFTSLINKKKLMVEALTGRLNALNPAAVLDRGYSITRSLPDRSVITDEAAVVAGQLLEILLAKGRLTCRVEKETSNGKKENF